MDWEKMKMQKRRNKKNNEAVEKVENNRGVEGCELRIGRRIKKAERMDLKK